MKSFFKSKTIIALAVAVAATAANATNANEQPIPPPAYAATALPANISPGTPLAEVYKLAQANVDVGVITAYITNASGAFNLDADKIIALTDVGAPGELINLMIAHDKNFKFAAEPAAPAPAPTDSVAPAAPTSTATYVAAPPQAPVTVQYFNESLTPYGGWVEVEGYGRCWRPSVVAYDTSWRPYCDRGRWVYSDCGWYWDSDYSWGVTFHYGRWFNHSRYGWCWWPDTVWAPSWVAWRSGGDYCGWAPLPPLTVYRPGLGFYYRGSGVSIGFDFGLSVSSYTFISVGRLCDRRPRYYCEDPRRGAQIYNNTTVINNYNYNDRSHTVINNGVPVERVSSASHRPIQTVAVNDLPNARRQGWRGENGGRDSRHDANDNNVGRNNPGGQTRPGGRVRDEQVGSTGNPDRRPGVGQNRQTQTGPVAGQPDNRAGNRERNFPNRNGTPVTPTDNATVRPTTPGQPDNRNANRERNFPNRPGNQLSPNVTPPANGNGTPSSVIVRDPVRRVDAPVIGGANQNNSPTAGSERWQNYREQSQPNQFQRPVTPSVPTTPSATVPQNNWSPNRNAGANINPIQPQRSAPAIEQRPVFTPQEPRVAAPSAPPALPDRAQNRVEQRQTAAPSAPSYTPPPPQVNEARSAARAEHAAERNVERSADRDRKDH